MPKKRKIKRLEGTYLLLITVIPEKSIFEERLGWLVGNTRIGTKIARLLPSYFSNILGNITRDWYWFLDEVAIKIQIGKNRKMILVPADRDDLIKEIEKAFRDKVIKMLKILEKNLRAYLSGKEIDLSYVDSPKRREMILEKMEEKMEEIRKLKEQLIEEGVDVDRIFEKLSKLNIVDRARIYWLPLTFGKPSEISDKARELIIKTQLDLEFLLGKFIDVIVRDMLDFEKKIQDINEALASGDKRRASFGITILSNMIRNFERRLQVIPISDGMRGVILDRLEDVQRFLEKKKEILEGKEDLDFISAKIKSISEVLKE